MRRTLLAAATILAALLASALVVPGAYADAPLSTEVQVISVSPSTPARAGQLFTVKVKVTAPGGSTPAGEVFRSAGACVSGSDFTPVGGDGTATMQFSVTVPDGVPTPYQPYVQICFRPADSDAYQQSYTPDLGLTIEPTSTTTTIVSVSPESPARSGQQVTVQVKVTAADGSTPVGSVGWSLGGCISQTNHTPVGADGIASVVITPTSSEGSTPHTTYLQMCFEPTDDAAYGASDDAQDYVLQPTSTTTEILSVTPAGGVHTGQQITFKAKVTAADGSTPVGTIGRSAGACMSPSDHTPVGPDGVATLVFTAIGPEGLPTWHPYLQMCFEPTDDAAYGTSYDAVLDDYPVGSLPTTTTPPSGTTPGQPVTFTSTVAASNGEVPPGSATWYDHPGCTGTQLGSGVLSPGGTTALSTTFASQGSYSRYACFVPADGSLFQSSDGSKTYAVSAPVTVAPRVTQHPASVVVVNGRQVTLTAAASGIPKPTVKWQRSTNCGYSWTDVPGATGTTLSFAATPGTNGSWYRAVFKNSVGTATTRPAVTTVTQTLLGFSAPKQGGTFKRGTSLPVAFTLGDKGGKKLTDAVAKALPAAVSVATTGGVPVGAATCPYSVSKHAYSCSVKLLSSLTPGTFRIAALIRLGSGPAVPAVGSSAAPNPVSIKVVK